MKKIILFITLCFCAFSKSNILEISPSLIELHSFSEEGEKEFNAKYKSDLTELELGYLRTYLKILSETPAEIVTYAFTNKQFANLANRIIVEEAPKIKKRKSLWDKIIDAILSIIGIDTITDNSLLNNVRNIVINSLDSVNSRRAKSPTSGRATSSPTGERSAGRSPAAKPT